MKIMTTSGGCEVNSVHKSERDFVLYCEFIAWWIATGKVLEPFRRMS